jgi:hypothetical protein
MKMVFFQLRLRQQVRKARDLQEPPGHSLPVEAGDSEARHWTEPPLRAVRLQRQGQERHVRPFRAEASTHATVSPRNLKRSPFQTSSSGNLF